MEGWGTLMTAADLLPQRFFKHCKHCKPATPDPASNQRCLAGGAQILPSPVGIDKGQACTNTIAQSWLGGSASVRYIRPPTPTTARDTGGVTGRERPVISVLCDWFSSTSDMELVLRFQGSQVGQAEATHRRGYLRAWFMGSLRQHGTRPLEFVRVSIISTS